MGRYVDSCRRYCRHLDRQCLVHRSAGDFDSGGSGLSVATRAEVSVSGDGRFVAFESDAGTLAAGDTNNRADVFVRDRDTGKTVLASVGSDGRQEAGQASRSAVLSRDGRYLAFMSFAKLEDADTNGAGDIYVRDLVAGTTARVSVGTEGQQGDNASVSPSTRFAIARWRLPILKERRGYAAAPVNPNNHFDPQQRCLGVVRHLSDGVLPIGTLVVRHGIQNARSVSVTRCRCRHPTVVVGDVVSPWLQAAIVSSRRRTCRGRRAA